MTEISNYAGGLYHVGAEVFVDKIQAILKFKETHQFPRFDFHDVEFSQHNWLEEPVEDLNQLYVNRAQELRNQYDYLVLHYSGGLDSSNILAMFISNNIHLDEIFIRGPYEATNKHDPNNKAPENQFAEVYFQAVPVAKMVLDQYLKNTKLTIIDTTKFTVDWFTKNPDWFQRTIDRATPSSMYKNFFDELNPTYKKLTDSGMHVGHIYGIDKPMLFYENNLFYVRFLDKMTNIHAVYRDEYKDVPYNVEYFYWGKTCAKLICKQAHLVKMFYKTMNIDPITLNNAGGREHHERLGSVLYNQSIIPKLYNPVEKSRLNTLEFDLTYFFNDKNSLHVKNWTEGIKQLQNIIPHDWIQDRVDTHFMTGIWTKPYCIGG